MWSLHHAAPVCEVFALSMATSTEDSVSHEKNLAVHRDALLCECESACVSLCVRVFVCARVIWDTDLLVHVVARIPRCHNNPQVHSIYMYPYCLFLYTITYV